VFFFFKQVSWEDLKTIFIGYGKNGRGKIECNLHLIL